MANQSQPGYAALVDIAAFTTAVAHAAADIEDTCRESFLDAFDRHLGRSLVDERKSSTGSDLLLRLGNQLHVAVQTFVDHQP